MNKTLLNLIDNFDKYDKETIEIMQKNDFEGKYSFSKKSLLNLKLCHKDLKHLFLEVIKYYDCTILEGYRNKEKQNKAFNEGKSKLKFPNSKHNQKPSLAIDVVPYPIDWNNIDRFKEFVSFVKIIAKALNINISCGGDWKNLKDYPHFELK